MEVGPAVCIFFIIGLLSAKHVRNMPLCQPLLVNFFFFLYVFFQIYHAINLNRVALLNHR